MTLDASHHFSTPLTRCLTASTTAIGQSDDAANSTTKVVLAASTCQERKTKDVRNNMLASFPFLASTSHFEGLEESP
jgi:hypothetical protein